MRVTASEKLFIRVPQNLRKVVYSRGINSTCLCQDENLYSYDENTQPNYLTAIRKAAVCKILR